MSLFLDKNVPLISKELLNPWRLASLGVGLVLLVLGSVYLPSDDWDVPLCFVMGLPAYVLAPWTVRQAFGLRWKWLVPAAFAFWLTVDGTYTLGGGGSDPRIPRRLVMFQSAVGRSM